MQTTHCQALRPSDVIAYLLHEGIEPAIAAFPQLEPHRAAAEQIVSANQELNELELKASEAQARLDAADKDLAALLAVQLKAAVPVAGSGHDA
jgi:hypothetical protein